MKKLLVTGSNGLIGSEVVQYFHARDWHVFGLDNNMRRNFFGAQADTVWMQKHLQETCANFHHYVIDIRDRAAILQLMATVQPDLVVNAAAQPSHDLAAARPFDDFEVNAVGTLNLLEAVRQIKPEAVFVHMSTNKVYGDLPNLIALVEKETRWDYADPSFADGIGETMSIDQSGHSLFGVSKAAADLLVQEYGRSFGMRTCCLRGGCWTGPQHVGVEMHGFLSYLVYCNLVGREYTIFGYKGKQVRDNLHAYDVARCIELFYEAPSVAAVFNLGGGRANAISILEAFTRVEAITGHKMRSRYLDQPRPADHICYISNLHHVKSSLPAWQISRSLDAIFAELVQGWSERLGL